LEEEVGYILGWGSSF